MAKAPKPTDTQTKTVPDAELVGDHANDPKFYPPRTQTLNDAVGEENLKAAYSVDHLLVLAEDHDFPLLEQACEAFIALHDHADIQAIRITEKGDGLRRGGMRHAGTVVHPVTAFTPAQLEQLLGEKLLIVEFISAEA